ncbi:hypothetical protein pb186bvf_011749 [Paramecium bursaria]
MNELFDLFKRQTLERKQQKQAVLSQLKIKKLKEIYETKTKLKEPIIYQPPIKYPNGVPRLFNKTEFNTQYPIEKNKEDLKPWIPTQVSSRILSACPPDTEVTPRQIIPKEKLWRPFSSQPKILNQIQLLPPTAKESHQASMTNILLREESDKLMKMKPFYPVRRICSAFPAPKK